MLAHRSRLARTTSKSFPACARRSGNTLIIAVVMITLISSLVIGFLSTAVDSQKWARQQNTERRLENAAESALSRGVHRLWGDFRRTYAGRRQTHWDVKFFLNTLGIQDQGHAATPVRTDLLALLDLPTDLDGGSELGRVQVEDISMWRVDGPTHVQLFFEATVGERSRNADRTGRQTKTIRQTFMVDGLQWDGLDYAVLANNVNCVMCHLRVDNVQRYYNRNPDDYGGFERVKLGSLESFQIRSAPDSWVAGTIYLNGLALHDDGTPVTDWTGVDVHSALFGDDGLLVEDAWGGLDFTDLDPADATNPQAMANLYLDYDSLGSDQVDGFMPSLFPSPFPDDGGVDLATGAPVPENADNRIVDYSEFLAVASNSDGTISGGTINVLDHDIPVSTTAELDAFMNPATNAALEGMTEGNVYLYGTEENPILLNGTIAVDGDLIIHGVVKGAGALMVSGNVYIPSDITYADGSVGPDGDRAFGFTSDGTENLLAIASGGNIAVGNVFRPNWGVGTEPNGDTSGSFNFIMEELSIFNRMEWLKTQPELDGKPEYVYQGQETQVIEHWNYQTEEYQVEQAIYDYVDVEYQVDEPIYDYVVVPYTVEEPVYEWIDDGTYKVLVGYQTVEKTRTDKIVVGYQTVTKTRQDKVIVGYETVTKTRQVKVGDPWYEDKVVDVYEWVTPTYANPYFMGPGYIPRYYNFTEGAKVPVFNKNGYFDPDTNTWLSSERPGAWDTKDLTIANPANTSDPLLYNPDGSPKAVISSLTATDGWMQDSLLRDMMQQWMGARDGSRPIEIDATLYTNNSIFGIIPKRNQPGSDGRMIINGGIVAADIGLLAPTELQINFDQRAGELLDLKADTQVFIRRQLTVPAVRP